MVAFVVEKRSRSVTTRSLVVEVVRLMVGLPLVPIAVFEVSRGEAETPEKEAASSLIASVIKPEFLQQLRAPHAVQLPERQLFDKRLARARNGEVAQLVCVLCQRMETRCYKIKNSDGFS